MNPSEFDAIVNQFTISGNEKVDYIHDDIYLDRVLPEYSSSTNIKNNEQRILHHEYMKDYERNTPLTNMSINPTKKGENNISSRQFQLSEKPQFGSFDGRGQMPLMNRVQQIPEYESDKSIMNRKIEKLVDVDIDRLRQ